MSRCKKCKYGSITKTCRLPLFIKDMPYDALCVSEVIITPLEPKETKDE